ncbi:hypothetical protein LZ30DRAFT_226030 [Colletotrichum cereale]|nr:hypothetical protein LZ30DRAFT_226030 [Colletotrichum cereale]
MFSPPDTVFHLDDRGVPAAGIPIARNRILTMGLSQATSCVLGPVQGCNRAGRDNGQRSTRGGDFIVQHRAEGLAKGCHHHLWKRKSLCSVLHWIMLHRAPYLQSTLVALGPKETAVLALRTAVWTGSAANGRERRSLATPLRVRLAATTREEKL